MMKTMIQPFLLAFYLLLFSTTLQAAEKVQETPTDDTALLVWANEAVIKIYTYNFANYQQQLQQAARYFTSEGWQVFINEFTDSKTLDTVKSNEYKVSAVATRPPVLLQKGLVGEKQFIWQVEMPILVLYQNAEGKEQEQHLTVQLSITENQTGVRGLGIVQFATEEE